MCHSFTLTIHIFPVGVGYLTGDLLATGHTQLPPTVWRMSPRIDCPLACVCACVCDCFFLKTATGQILGPPPTCQYHLTAADAKQEPRVSHRARFSCIYMFACVCLCVCACGHNGGYRQAGHATVHIPFESQTPAQGLFPLKQDKPSWPVLGNCIQQCCFPLCMEEIMFCSFH